MGERLKQFLSRRSERAQSAAERRYAAHRDSIDPDAISYEEAARQLGRTEVFGLLRYRILDPAVMKSGFDGVTQESVDRELEWQRTAPGWKRAMRRTQEWMDWM